MRLPTQLTWPLVRLKPSWIERVSDFKKLFSVFTWSGGSWRRGEAGLNESEQSISRIDQSEESIYLDQPMQVPITRLPSVAARVAKYWGPFLEY